MVIGKAAKTRGGISQHTLIITTLRIRPLADSPTGLDASSLEAMALVIVGSEVEKEEEVWE